MGCCYSSFDSSPPSDCVRVIRITGHVEDLRAPVTAGQLTGRPPKDVLFCGTHLSTFGTNPLRPNDRLEPGRVYFLLPHAALRCESSAVDLAALMARLLAAAAKRSPSPVPPPAVTKPECRPRAWARSWKPELEPIEERSAERDGTR